MANSFLDKDGLLYLWQKITNKFVLKVDGKGLSTNDFTDELKTKLTGIAEGANKTVVEDNLISNSPTNALSANQGRILDEKIKTINDNMADLGAGDMLRSVYDTDQNGVVDNADKLGGQTPDYYAKDSDISKVGKSGKYSDLLEVPSTFAPSTHTHAIVDINGLKDALDEAASAEHEHTTADITDFATEMAKKADTTHSHQKSDITGLEDTINTVTEIAQGKCKSYVFETVAELDTWLGVADNTANLKTGDVFLIRAVDVPDYWWDGETSSKRILETTKVELTAITNAEIDTIVAS